MSHYHTDTDADGNVTGYTYDTTSTDINGTYSWINHYDASWNLTETDFTDNNGVSSIIHVTSIPLETIYIPEVIICYDGTGTDTIDLITYDASANTDASASVTTTVETSDITTSTSDVSLVGVTHILQSDFVTI